MKSHRTHEYVAAINLRSYILTQVMLSLKRLPIGLELFMAAIRSVRLINRLSKSPKVIQSLKNMFDDEPLVTLDTGINFL